MGSISPAPRGITPVNYRLSIFDIKLVPEWQFGGHITIEARVFQLTTDIVLHAAGLSFNEVEISQDPEQTTHLCTSIHTSSSADGTTRLKLASPLDPGHVFIKIHYTGSIGNSMVGFYRARYRDLGASRSIIRDGENAVILATHFEPCHARFAFPCFDEPHLKATFDFDIEIPEGLTALSNTSVKSTTKLTGPKEGLQLVHFERTPIMSTYLLAWAVGEFEYVEAFTESYHGGIRVPVRIYTPPGLVKYAPLALECAWKVLDLFKKLFDVDYPMNKSDHVIVPEFVSGAMENWGLITYKPTKILFDPKTSNNRVMSKVVYVVAHELAHHWFGNLVTMDNWSELWLNEGFATWAGYLAVDYLFPELSIWGQYTSEILDDALKLDSLPTTHAIKTHVENENDIQQMFDQISYFKGSAIIRMLAAHSGEDIFLKGLSYYLKKHAYQNARSQDLWEALSMVSGLNVSELMDSYIYTGGFPLVQRARSSNGQVNIKQRSILSPDDHDNPGAWQIPMLEDNLLGLLNKGHVGYYCVDYSRADMDSLVKSLPTLTTADIAGVLVDTSILVMNSLKPTSELLDFMWRIRDTNDCFAWLSMSRSLAFICSIFDDAKIQTGLKSFTASLIATVEHQLQWTADPMPYTQAELNKVIVKLAFTAGSAHCDGIIQETKQYFDKWAVGDTKAIAPSMRGVVLACGVNTGGKADLDALKQAFLTDDSLDGQEILLMAMGSVNTCELAEDVLDFVFASDTVDLQHLNVVGAALGQNSACREAQWVYVTNNWPMVWKRLQANSVCRDWWIEESLSHYSDLKLGDEIKSFLLANVGKDAAKPVRNVEANIQRNARYRESAREDILQWLALHGFGSA